MSDGDYVVLLHGLGRTALSMGKIQKYLLDLGYQVLNINYPSTKLPIERIAEEYLSPMLREFCSDSTKKINFVTHSMGGIVVRQYLKNNKPNNLGRVVMMAPPNQGTEIVDGLKDWSLFKRLLGPAGQQLGTTEKCIPRQLPKVDFELGIIAGDKPQLGLGFIYLSGTHDGTVQVNSAQIPEMKDFILVNRTHSFIMQAPEVLRQINHFLSFGYFEENLCMD